LTVNTIQHAIPDAHLTAIGDITVSFALLEFYHQMLVEYLLFDKSSVEQQRISRVISDKLPIHDLESLLVNLFFERCGKKEVARVEDFKKLVNRIDKVSKRRNSIIHSIWSIGKDGEKVSRSNTQIQEDQGANVQNELDISADELSDFATSIKALAYDIQALLFNLPLTSEAK